MQSGQSLISLSAVDPASVVAPELFLALALLTLGIARDPHANGGEITEFVEEVSGQKQRRFAFVFDPKGTDGVDTATWIKRWSDDQWLAANPTHPLAAYRALAATYAGFSDWMKAHDPVLVFRQAQGGSLAAGRRERIAYVPKSLMGTPRGAELLRKAGIAV